MKIISVQPYAVMTCNAPTGVGDAGAKKRDCINSARHMVTVQNNPSNKFAYSSYRLCDGHLDKLKEAVEKEGND